MSSAYQKTVPVEAGKSQQAPSMLRFPQELCAVWYPQENAEGARTAGERGWRARLPERFGPTEVHAPFTPGVWQLPGGERGPVLGGASQNRAWLTAGSQDLPTAGDQVLGGSRGPAATPLGQPSHQLQARHEARVLTPEPLTLTGLGQAARGPTPRRRLPVKAVL